MDECSLETTSTSGLASTTAGHTMNYAQPCTCSLTTPDLTSPSLTKNYSPATQQECFSLPATYIKLNSKFNSIILLNNSITVPQICTWSVKLKCPQTDCIWKTKTIKLFPPFIYLFLIILDVFNLRSDNAGQNTKTLQKLMFLTPESKLFLQQCQHQ